MASQSVRILDPQPLGASAEQPRDQVVDLGAYKQLVASCRVLKVGSGAGGGRVKLQTAAVNEPGAFHDVAGLSWVVDGSATGGMASSGEFLRYVRWVTDAGVAGSPVVCIDVVAKE